MGELYLFLPLRTLASRHGCDIPVHRRICRRRIVIFSQSFFLHMFGLIIERFVGGKQKAFSVSFIGERLGRCRQGWLQALNASGRNEEASGLIFCFPFYRRCSRLVRQYLFRKVLVAGFSIAYPVRFLEADAGTPRPINRGQF